GLLAAVGVVGHTRKYAHIGERSVLIIVIEKARSAVAGHIDVRPTVVVIVKRRNAEAIVSQGAVDVGRSGHVLKVAVPQITVKDIPAGRQAARPAEDSDALPQAARKSSRRRGPQ